MLPSVHLRWRLENTRWTIVAIFVQKNLHKCRTNKLENQKRTQKENKQKWQQITNNNQKYAREAFPNLKS